MIVFVCFYICGYDMVFMVLSKVERREAKLMRILVWGCFFMVLVMFLYIVKIENNVFLDVEVYIMRVLISENIILLFVKFIYVL